MLTDDELAQVWAVYAESRNAEAMELLVQQYSGLASYLARRSLAKAPAHQDAEDILSYAHHGLIDALQRFDLKQGVKFETYATRRISGAIVDGQRKQDPLARATRRKVKLVEAAINELWERLQREPTLEEISDTIGDTVDNVRMALVHQKSLHGSLDVENGVQDTRGLDSEAEVVMHLADARVRVAERLAKLPARARAFLVVYYCEDTNLKETSEALGISGELCRQTRNQVLDTIRG